MTKSAYLITGSPGTGKTSLIKAAVKGFPGRAGGFYTEEIRRSGVREGFKLISLSGDSVTLAHTGFVSARRVGKYGVDVAALDRVGVAALKQATRQGALVIVDEIGKMELFSPAFREAVMEAVLSGNKVLGTVMLSPHPFADEVKRHPRVRLLSLSRPLFSQVLHEVEQWLRE